MGLVAEAIRQVSIEQLSATSANTIEDGLLAEVLAFQIPANATCDFRLGGPSRAIALPIIALPLPQYLSQILQQACRDILCAQPRLCVYHWGHDFPSDSFQVIIISGLPGHEYLQLKIVELPRVAE